MKRWVLTIAVTVVALSACSGFEESLHFVGVKHPHTTSITAQQPFFDWPTFCYDNRRSCFLPFDPTAGRGWPTKLKWQFQADAPVAAQPILATGLTVNGTAQNVLYVATENSTIYALDANASQAAGHAFWVHPFADAQSNQWCYDMPGGIWGTTSTPVLDKLSNRLYVVDGEARLHALNLSTGADTTTDNWPIHITNAYREEHVYGALTLNASGDTIYATTAGICDTTPYQGRIVAIDTGVRTSNGKLVSIGSARTLSEFVPSASSGAQGGGVWGMAGVSIAPESYLNVATGNAIGTGVAENAGDNEKIIDFDAQLNKLSEAGFQASPPPGADWDFGTTPTPMLCGSTPYVAAPNKSGDLAYTSESPGMQEFVSSLAMANPNGSGPPAAAFLGPAAYDWNSNQLHIGVPEFDDRPGNGGVEVLQFDANCRLVRVAETVLASFTSGGGSLASINKYPSTLFQTAAGPVTLVTVSAPGSGGNQGVVDAIPANGAQPFLFNSQNLITTPLQQPIAPPVFDGNIYISSFWCGGPNGNCYVYALGY